MEDKYIVIISIHADPAMAPGYDEWGGTHTYMKELLDNFGKFHIHAIMFTRKSMKQLLDCEQYNDYATLYRLKNGDENPIDKNLLYKYHEQNKEQIKEILQPYKNKIVAFHSVYWNSGRIAMELSEEWKIPFVHSVISNEKGRLLRGATSQSSIRVKFEEKIFKNAKKILCVSEDEKSDLIHLYGIHDDKIIVAGQEVNKAFLSPCQDSNGFPKLNANLSLKDQQEIAKKYNLAFESFGKDHFWMNKAFTYLGRVYYNKGVIVIIKSWLKIYEKYGDLTPPLWIIGGSLKEIEETRTYIKNKFCENLNIIENKFKIIWWGCLDYQSISTLFLKSLALIMHSYYEPGGRVIVEAMATGLPVLATPNGFGKDYIHDWENGFLIDYGDIKKLSQSMEYFIRQPYISPAMGENAQQMAYYIIKKWDFFNNHLISYGLRNPKIINNNLQISDCMFKREINVYPFYHKKIEITNLKSIIEHHTNETAIDIYPLNENATSHVYIANTCSHHLVIKEVYYRFTLSPLYNPIDKTLIRDKNEFYKIEKRIYQLYFPQYLIGYDDNFCLLLIKKHDPIKQYSKNILMKMILYLENNNLQPTMNEKNIYKKIMSCPMMTLSDIQNIFQLLNQFEDYYFECTGFFSAELSWSIAPILLEYNKDFLSETTIQKLNEYIQYYSHLKKEDFSSLTLVNMDLAAHHFLEENGKIIPIDFEKLCIGVPEANIACLLYDITRRNYLTVNEALNMMLQQPFDMSLILQILAYRYYYQIIMAEVMKKDSTLLFKKLQNVYQFSLKYININPQ